MRRIPLVQALQIYFHKSTAIWRIVLRCRPRAVVSIVTSTEQTKKDDDDARLHYIHEATDVPYALMIDDL